VPFLFCKAIKGRKVDELIENAGKGGGPAVASAGPATAKVEEKKVEKKEEVVEAYR